MFGVGAKVNVVFIICRTVNVVIMSRSSDGIVVINLIVAIDIMSGVSCIFVSVIKI